MHKPKVTVVIPFRLREGADMRRSANLEVVTAWWYAHGLKPEIISDGLSGDAQFNRHRAYNRATEKFPETEVFVFTEADMLIHPSQIHEAVKKAYEHTGLVVPFTQYRYLSDSVTSHIRSTYHDLPSEELAEWWALPAKHPASVFDMRAESVMDNGRSIGAVNVVSRQTLNATGGFTERTSGNWYDDNIIEEAFKFLAGPTRWVNGPAVHLFHLPGWTGEHLTAADKAATARNKNLLIKMRADIRLRNRAAVRELMTYRQESKR